MDSSTVRVMVRWYVNEAVLDWSVEAIGDLELERVMFDRVLVRVQLTSIDASEDAVYDAELRMDALIDPDASYDTDNVIVTERLRACVLDSEFVSEWLGVTECEIPSVGLPETDTSCDTVLDREAQILVERDLLAEADDVCDLLGDTESDRVGVRLGLRL